MPEKVKTLEGKKFAWEMLMRWQEALELRRYFEPRNDLMHATAKRAQGFWFDQFKEACNHNDDVISYLMRCQRRYHRLLLAAQKARQN